MNQHDRDTIEDAYEYCWRAAEDLGDTGADLGIGDLEDAASDIQNILARVYRKHVATDSGSDQ